MEKMVEEVGGRGTPSLEQLKREYEHYLELPSAQDVQIDLDVPRTISGHVLFHTRYGQGQRALFHVLHAFGLRSENVGGYCQGMGPIAATLLCYFEPEVSLIVSPNSLIHTDPVTSRHSEPMLDSVVSLINTNSKTSSNQVSQV